MQRSYTFDVNDHIFYLILGARAVLLENCGVAEIINPSQ